MAINFIAGAEALQDLVATHATLTGAYWPWNNQVGAQPKAYAGFHQTGTQAGLVSWQIDGYSISQGLGWTISGDWTYFQTLFRFDIDLEAQWTMFHLTDTGNPGVAYAVGIMQLGSGANCYITLWKKDGQLPSSVSYTHLESGSIDLSFDPSLDSATIYRLNIKVNQRPSDDSGTAEVNGIGNDELYDSDKSWDDTGNGEWDGFWVYLTGGTGAGQSKEILSNTTNTLTVASNWTTNPDATTTYVIADEFYRRIYVYINSNEEINHTDTDCNTSEAQWMSLVQHEINAGKNAEDLIVRYDHATWNDDGGSDANLKGLLGADWAVCGYQPHADVDDPNDYTVGQTGTGANTTTGEDGGNAWLQDTDEEWKPANEWLGALVTCNGKTFVVTGNTGTDRLDGTGGWDDAIPGDGLLWFVRSTALGHKKYRALDDKNEKNPGPASGDDAESTFMYSSSHASKQGIAMANAEHAAGSPQSVDVVIIYSAGVQTVRLCSGADSGYGLVSGGYLATPWGDPWSIANWNDLQLTFWAAGGAWILAEVGGHRLKTCPANDNDAAENSDETANCAEGRRAFGQVV